MFLIHLDNRRATRFRVPIPITHQNTWVIRLSEWCNDLSSAMESDKKQPLLPCYQTAPGGGRWALWIVDPWSLNFHPQQTQLSLLAGQGDTLRPHLQLEARGECLSGVILWIGLADLHKSGCDVFISAKASRASPRMEGVLQSNHKRKNAMMRSGHLAPAIRDWEMLCERVPDWSSALSILQHDTTRLSHSQFLLATSALFSHPHQALAGIERRVKSLSFQMYWPQWKPQRFDTVALGSLRLRT